MQKIEGAYALVVISPRKMIEREIRSDYVRFVSEKETIHIFLHQRACAIAAVGGEFVRDVEPGEIVSFTKNGITSDKWQSLS